MADNNTNLHGDLVSFLLWGRSDGVALGIMFGCFVNDNLIVVTEDGCK